MKELGSEQCSALPTVTQLVRCGLGVGPLGRTAPGIFSQLLSPPHPPPHPPPPRGRGPAPPPASLSTGLLVNRLRDGMEFAGAGCGQWVRGVTGKQERGLMRWDWGWEQGAWLALQLCSSAHQGQALSRGAPAHRGTAHTGWSPNNVELKRNLPPTDSTHCTREDEWH